MTEDKLLKKRMPSSPDFPTPISPVSATALEIPPAAPGEDVDSLLRKLENLRAMTGNIPSPSSYSTVSSTAIPPIQSLGQLRDPAFRNPEASPASIPSIPSPSPSLTMTGLVQQLRTISEEKNDSTFESRIADRPKTILEEYGQAKIYRVQGEPLPYYWVPVARPTLSERSIINTLKEATTRLISITPYRIRDPEQKRNVYAQQVIDILRSSPELKVPTSKFDFYATAVVSEMVGYGLIDPLVKDDRLEEIMVIGPNVPVFVFHRTYDMMVSNVEFSSDVEIQDLVNRIAREVGRRVDISSPLLDARLSDGSRVNATIPPASVSGSTLTIRKFRADPYSIIDLINYKTISTRVAAFLWLCVDGLMTQPANILISGGTSSGKTTLLNVLCSFIPANERIISIEDTSELNLPLQHWIRLEGRPPGLEGKGEITLDILTKNSLRMRPDRIIVGEVRHDEAFSLFTAMNTGHDGCLTYDTRIPFADGVREIGSFVDEQLEKNNSRKDGEWDVCSVSDSVVTSLDANGKAVRSSVVEARRRPFEGIVYRIQTASGNAITCTGNHPFYQFKDGKMVSIPANRLEEGMSVAVPMRIIRDENVNAPEIEYWSGLLHGDGHIADRERVRVKNGKSYRTNDGEVSLYSEEGEIIPSFRSFIDGVLNNPHQRTVLPRPEKGCFEVHVSGHARAQKMQELLHMSSGSRLQSMMDNHHFVSSLREFVAGFFDAEGHVDLNNNALVFTCANEYYIDFFRYALWTEGILSRKYETKSNGDNWYRLYVYGLENVRKFASIYPIRYPAKIQKLNQLVSSTATPNTNVDVIPCNHIISILLGAAKEKGYSRRAIARRAGISQGLLQFIVHNKRMPSRKTVCALSGALESIGVDASLLSKLSSSDTGWDPIVSIHSYPYLGFVYDFTLNEKIESGLVPHNFVAEGFLVGNSMGTIHANSAAETLVRVTSPPMSVPEVMLSGLNFVIVENLFHSPNKGSYRRVTEIAEVIGVIDKKARTQTIFAWDPVKDEMQRTNIPIKYFDRLASLTGMKVDDLEVELRKRERFLQSLIDRGVRDMNVVSKLAQEFLGGN
ncbi:MAG: ATPase, T2SS/T4P/T4SS family [Candidatus Diapherotrites archaeon]